jgi:hypothetical protein
LIEPKVRDKKKRANPRGGEKHPPPAGDTLFKKEGGLKALIP